MEAWQNITLTKNCASSMPNDGWVRRACCLQLRLPPLKKPAPRRSSTSVLTIRRSNSMEHPIVLFAFTVFTHATPAPDAWQFAQHSQCLSEDLRLWVCRNEIG